MPRRPDDETLETYEAVAAQWTSTRHPGDPTLLDDLASRIEASAVAGLTADLGCGPGWHLRHLPSPTIALDGTMAMLSLALEREPGCLPVQADLRSLPFRRGALAGAWASRSLVHLARAEVPAALADLHRSLHNDGVVGLTLLEGDLEHGELPQDDFPGRQYSRWTVQPLVDVLEGGGFSIEWLDVRPSTEDRIGELGVVLRREWQLPDYVADGLRLLLVGLNPSPAAADAGVGFARAGNRFWPALLGAGLATVDRDPRHLLRHHRTGMTDLVKRTTRSASELSRDEFETGVARLERLVAQTRPRAVCMVGLSGWRAAVDRRATAGVQGRRLGDRPVYLMPNPSGLNANHQLPDFVDYFQAAAELADRST